MAIMLKYLSLTLTVVLFVRLSAAQASVKCPAVPIVHCFVAGEKKCSNDESCSGTSKCCGTLCGGTECIDPAVAAARPRCPYLNLGIRCIQQNPTECTSSSVCPAGSTCCTYECGGAKCVPELCPAFDPSIVCSKANPKECNSAFGCDGGKCCEYECGGTKCIKDAVAPQVKSGQCPFIDPRLVICAATPPLRDGCKSDSDCLGDLKCCSHPCSGVQCVKPATVKDGQCPVVDTTVVRCRENKEGDGCKTDDNCPGSSKCCKTACRGLQCTAPAVSIKSGTCPMLRGKRQAAGLCVEACRDDSGCPGDQKCCSGPVCGKSCMSPTRTAKPGTCPVWLRGKRQAGGSCVNDCSDDSSCPGDQKCCSVPVCGRSCMNAVPTIKPGTCPVWLRGKRQAAGPCVNACQDDSSCRGDQKCCSSPVCEKSCMNPTPTTKPKPGTCPVWLRGKRQAVGPCVYACRDDSSCPGDQKCCSVPVCGRSCMNPTPTNIVKAGTCPILYGGTIGICVQECNDDSSCSGAKKCCKNGCGMVCVDPADRSPPTVKAGTTPPPVIADRSPPTVKGDSLALVCPVPKKMKCIKNYPSKCSIDAQCPGNRKCCASKCNSMQCLTPVRQGKCPVIDWAVVLCATPTAESSSDKCGTDMSCPAGQKCCEVACSGRRCVNAV